MIKEKIKAAAANPVILPQIGGTEIRKWLGKPIDNPGIYKDMPISIYHSRNAAADWKKSPSVSSGNLRTIFTKSPAHYWCDSYYNDDRPEEDEEESEALLFGRAAHHWLFGMEEEFWKEFTVAPNEIPNLKTGELEPFGLNRTSGKDWAEKNAKGRTILRQKKHADPINGMEKSLKQHPITSQGLLNGFIETSWFWKHEKTGLWLKIRPDCAPNDSLDFADLKTVRDLDWNTMQYGLFGHGYFIQAGLTAMGVEALTGKKLNSFTFCFIEKKSPYDIAIVKLKDHEIDRGIRAAEKAIATFVECYKTGVWPGRYSDRPWIEIEMAEWQQKSIDARLETM